MKLLIRIPNTKKHPKQREFVTSKAKRQIVRAGRRSGKTVGAAIKSVKKFLKGKRVLYATPTNDQLERFWFEVTSALAEPIKAGIFYKNETEHVIERVGTLQRIRAKTAWNADTLRGDFADLLILDEYQLMNEDAWELVGAPMLLDNNGDAVFIYTPPSLRTRSLSKARDKLHAAKLFKKAKQDNTGRWQTFSFTSHDNPHLSKQALGEITQDMTRLAYEQEILAVDKEDAPGALWTRSDLENCRVMKAPELSRIVVAIDPAVTSNESSDDAGIIVAGKGPCDCQGRIEEHAFVLHDGTLHGSPGKWASEAVSLYHKFGADRIVAETNNGGEMVELTIKTIKDAPSSIKQLHASRGKAARAEPISALYEQDPEKGIYRKAHHVGNFDALENELCNWVPGSGMQSPNRLDALVWALIDLMQRGRAEAIWISPGESIERKQESGYELA